MVVVQYPAQSLPSPDRSTMRRQTSLGNNEAVAKRLVIPFLMVMCHEPQAKDQRTVRLRAKQNHLK